MTLPENCVYFSLSSIFLTYLLLNGTLSSLFSYSLPFMYVHKGLFKRIPLSLQHPPPQEDTFADRTRQSLIPSPKSREASRPHREITRPSQHWKAEDTSPGGCPGQKLILPPHSLSSLNGITIPPPCHPNQKLGTHPHLLPLTPQSISPNSYQLLNCLISLQLATSVLT